ncbi:septum formation initiator family protein [Streptomyces radicis]|uniref:Septum formation initiator n=1 Tax=Streptomyces radicis TaxID=1750517 RepID=A0A3A9VYV9_9ACTN|nr:septum formation initiator family protein [Streptomyces radicis]RKN06111.1 septum formation initiator [Streptomyces radicis]RKN18480.1 septum formation initiator [Streptomyces radicis]
MSRSRGPGPQTRLTRLAGLVPTRSSSAARAPFVLLVVGLLGLGMIALLFLNASLNQGSFELSELRRETRELTDEGQELQAEVDGYAAPDALAERARELGLVPAGPPAFIGPDGTVLGEAEPAPEPAPEPTPEPDDEAEGDDAANGEDPADGSEERPEIAPQSGGLAPAVPAPPGPPAPPTAPPSAPGGAAETQPSPSPTVTAPPAQAPTATPGAPRPGETS